MVHVKYPSMERQDLTQAQLGSFKFTPVDEAAPSCHPHSLLLQQYRQSSGNARLLRQSTSSPDVASDASFFNQQIRPSLDHSRLRLGPAAVRAAVESASTSPQKRFGRRVQGTMRPNAQSFQPQYLGSENDSAHSAFTSEGNGLSLSLTKTDASCGPPLDFAVAHSSILRALEAEQIAHESTKAQLEQEVSARHEAEAETTRLAECNKGLINSINLLKSTVRHMVQKENDPAPDTTDLDRAVKEFNRTAQNAKPNDSILYDLLSDFKPTKNGTRSGEESMASFDLDLLNSHNQNRTSQENQTQRDFQHQTDLSSAVLHTKLPGTECKQKTDPIVKDDQKNLSDISVSSDVGEEHQQVVPTSEINPNVSIDATHVMLELPASFLNKYTKQRANQDSKDLLPVDTPKKTTITSKSGTTTRLCQSEHNTNPNLSKVIWMPDSPLINWKIDNRHSDELRGNSNIVQTRSLDSHFLDYPLRYLPNVLDDNLYRTVMIDFIPFGTPYSDVLNQIRGGTLESIQLYGPIGHITDFVTARIVYTDENGATALYRRGQDPGIKINGTPVRVWQILEATYPKNKELEEAVYSHGHTRILVIHAPIDNISDLLKRKLRSQIEAGFVLDIGRSHDGVPLVEFTSIEEATKALKAFMDDKDFAGADFDFDDDYCNSRFADEIADDALT